MFILLSINVILYLIVFTDKLCENGAYFIHLPEYQYNFNGIPNILYCIANIILDLIELYFYVLFIYTII